MRFLVCSMVALVALPVVPAWAGDCSPGANNGDPWCDDFESYPLGSIQGMNGWQGWGPDPGDPAVAGTVTSQQNNTPGGSKSLGIDTLDDTVRQYMGYGVDENEYYIYVAHVYFPSSTTGAASFILQNSYDGGGAGTNWSTQLVMDSDLGTIASDFDDETLPLITDEWVEIRVEVNMVEDIQFIYYDDVLLIAKSWTEGVSGAGELNIASVDLYSSTAEPRVYFDDLSLEGMTVPDVQPPSVECTNVDFLENGCGEFVWSVRNVNVTAAISEFYVDFEAGDGAQTCTDVTPPDGFTAENCTGWVDGHALYRFTGPAFPPGAQVFGRLVIDTNGDTETPGSGNLTVPPFSVLMHAAQTDGDAVCAEGDFSFGPTTALGDWSQAHTCTAFLPVPTFATWSKVVLAAMLAGAGLVIIRCRRWGAAAQ